MSRKGFTLIELIATIALLGIIATISFVSINKAIKQGKIEDCKTLVNNIKTAASEYVSDNRYNSTFVSTVGNDDGITINADTLISGNYLTSPIYNPFDKSEMNASDIQIEIELNGDYTAKNIIVSDNNGVLNCDS